MNRIKQVFFSFFILILCVIIGNFIINDIKQYDSFKKYFIPNDLFHLVDNFDNSMEQLRKDENFTLKLQNINSKLQESTNYSFVECRMGLGYMQRSIPLPIETNINRNNLQEVDILQVGSNIKELFPLTIQDGEFFSKNDFYYESNKIPVLVGAAFKNKNGFNLGDEFNCIVSGKDYIFIIKGILAESEYIIYFNQKVYLDKFFIMPFQMFDLYDEQELKNNHVFYTLLEKNNGIIKCHNKAGEQEVEDNLEALCANLNLPPYSLSVKYNEIKNEILGKLAIKIALFFLLIIILYTYYKKKKHRKICVNENP